VAIRTVVVDRSTDTAVYGTGGGITWASDQAAGYAELLTKANLLPTIGGVPHPARRSGWAQGQLPYPPLNE
jgi:anthranilate/para-aminobenzoate synthase component I